MTKVAKKKSEVPVVEKSEGRQMLEDCMVRISADKAEYVKFFDDGGFFIAAGSPRVPEIHKDIRVLLISALRNGGAFFATAGGFRVMASPTGKGGLFFIEKKSMLSGKEIYLLNCKERVAADKAGLVPTRESKGVYVTPRNKEGKAAYTLIAENFGNNSSPMNFVVHPWKGYNISEAEVKKSAKKLSKADEGSSAKKVVAKVNEKDGPEKKVVNSGKKVLKSPEKTKTTTTTVTTTSASPEKRVVKKVSKKADGAQASA